MDASIVAVMFLGFLYGLRHALDPDHLVAVSTIVSQHRDLARSSLVGTFWGLGHTTSLLAIGLVVILLRVSIPPHVALWMEMAVAVMLITLGANVLLRTARERGLQLHIHQHSHDDETNHTHIHIHTEEDDNRHHHHRHLFFRIGGKPFIVGMVHGMAGSAALTLLVLSTIPSVALGLLYIAVFGLGSVGGMLLMSTMISLPFIVTARRFSLVNFGIRLLTGVFSLLFGLMLAWQLLKELI
jgi:ABC-type nickel/cobalt efflux system permease component RcnA